MGFQKKSILSRTIFVGLTGLGLCFAPRAQAKLPSHLHMQLMQPLREMMHAEVDELSKKLSDPSKRKNWLKLIKLYQRKKVLEQNITYLESTDIVQKHPLKNSDKDDLSEERDEQDGAIEEVGSEIEELDSNREDYESEDGVVFPKPDSADYKLLMQIAALNEETPSGWKAQAEQLERQLSDQEQVDSWMNWIENEREIAKKQQELSEKIAKKMSSEWSLNLR